MRDFTSGAYILLIESIRNAGYVFQTVSDFLEKPAEKVVVLRHDSDIWPDNDLKFAGIENRFNIKASYYFRIPHTFNIKIINDIIDLGHEIGYHYEDLTNARGNLSKAIATFKKNLEKLRELYPVKTVAMHGRPLLKWDNRKLWEKYSPGEFGLTGEAYISIDYHSVLYLTDNGSCWNGEQMNIRDTVESGFNYKIRTTFQLIEAFKNDLLPDRIIINIHSARWNDNLGIWTYRYLLQKVKNITKYFFKFILR